MLVVIGGHTRNIGKTSVICSILRSTLHLNWTAIKITQYGHGVCSTDGEDCECAVPDHRFALAEEKGTGSGTGYVATPRGGRAAQVTGLERRQEILVKRSPALRRIWERGGNTIVESNSILQFVKPDLYLTVLDFGIQDFKDSSLRYLDRADAVVSVASGQAVWKEVSGSLWRGKPRFAVSPPDYFCAGLKGLITERLAST